MRAATRSLTDTLRGRRVIVESEHGQRFEGYLDRVSWPDRHVLLRDVTERPGGASYPSAAIAHVDWIVPTAGEDEVIEMDPRDVALPAFAVADFEAETHSEDLCSVVERGFAGGFPVVTRRDGGLELVEGHWALWAAQQAGLDTHPIIVASLSRWEQAARFAFAHFPLPHHLDADDGRPERRYSDDALRVSISQYFEEFGDVAFELFPVQFNVERLGITVGDSVSD